MNLSMKLLHMKVVNVNLLRLFANLELFIKVMDKLGVKLENDVLYEEYQKIYDETVSRSVEKDKGQEKMWNRGRGR